MSRSWCWLLLLLGLLGCSQADSQSAPGADSAEPGDPTKNDRLIPVKLMLNWYAEAEHGGYYAALVAGDYREAGLDVTIVPTGPNSPVIQDVARGNVAFGVSNADNVLFARAQQAPVVAVMAPLQTSPRCLIVHKSSGITRFDQLHDMTIAVTPGAAFVEFMKLHAPLKRVQFVPYNSVQGFLSDDSAAQQGYVFSEPYVAREKGGDPQILMLADLGYNPYTSLLVTSEEEIRQHADVVRRMVVASVRGWQRYLSEPQQANEAIHKENPAIDLPALKYGAQAIAPLVETDETRGHGLGTMSLARWQTLAEQLVESKQLAAGKVDPKMAFTDAFLPQAAEAPAPARE